MSHLSLLEELIAVLLNLVDDREVYLNKTFTEINSRMQSFLKIMVNPTIETSQNE